MVAVAIDLARPLAIDGVDRFPDVGCVAQRSQRDESRPFVDEGDQSVCSGLVLLNSVWQRYQEVAVMKLEIARGLFLAAALAVASLAAAAWQEPTPEVLTHNGLGYCPLPPKPQPAAEVRPDHDLLLFLFSMSQGLGPRG